MRSRISLDAAWDALRRATYPGDRLPPEREASLLRRARVARERRSARRVPRVVAAVALLGLCAFVAGGGVKKVRQWLVRMELFHPDGRPAPGSVRGVREGADGATAFDLQVGDRAAEVQVSPADQRGDRRVEVDLHGAGDERGVIEIRKRPANEEK